MSIYTIECTVSNYIGAISADSLFGAACKVVNTVLGDLQNRLLVELQANSPLSPFQQFVDRLTVGYIAPLASFVEYGTSARSTTATVDGMVTGNRLWRWKRPCAGGSRPDWRG